jgi:hypothetical protein
MAVLEKRFSDEEWKALTSLSAGRLRILAFPSSVERGHRRFAIHDSQWRRVGLTVDYEGVALKFECFFLRLLDPAKTKEAVELIESIDCDSIAAIHRSEWIRAALPEEIRPKHEAIVQRRGRSSERSADQLSSCRAPVGLLFLRRDEEVGLLGISDDDPLTMIFTTEKATIARYIAECDVDKSASLQA